MGNILTLAQKELRAYFVSPIAYVLLVFFAAPYTYGWGRQVGIHVRNQGALVLGRGNSDFERAADSEAAQVKSAVARRRR